jgi:DNA-binding FadR family transcriptional regulator
MTLSGLVIGPIRPPQLYERIVAEVKAQIASGRLSPGDRLPSERELARMLEVSRPSVREAIAALQNDGIVQTRPGSGSFIADDAHELLDRRPEVSAGMADASPFALLEVRLFFEPGVARLAARRASPDPAAERLLDEIEAIAALERERGLDDPAQRKRWSDADRLFHHQIALMADNPLIAEMSQHISAVMDEPLWRRLRDEAAADVHRARLYAAEHRMIYEAVVGGNPDTAAFYAEHHVLRVRNHMALE